MPKVISSGKAKINVAGGLSKPVMKEINLRDYDDGFYGHMSVKKAHKGHKVDMCGRGDDDNDDKDDD